MSQENVEIVRGIYESWGRGDFRAGVELQIHRFQQLLQLLHARCARNRRSDALREQPRQGYLRGGRVQFLRG